MKLPNDLICDSTGFILSFEVVEECGFVNGKVELRTNKYEDDTFQYRDGIYTKYVDISECENLKYICCI